MSSSSSSNSSDSRHSRLKRKRGVDDAASESTGSVSDSSDSESEGESQPEIPVLSHAERRRQKKRASTAARSDEQLPSSKKRKVDQTSTVTKRQNSVWVGNLPFTTTVESLRAFFGDVGEVTRVHMPMKASRGGPATKTENRGFAYVDFATLEAKSAAIAKSEQPLLGRRLLIKNGDDFTGRPVATGDASTMNNLSPVKGHPGTGHTKTAQKILRAQKQQPAPTLFLGNLGFETTEKSIRELFESHRPNASMQKAKAKVDPEAEAEANANHESKESYIRKVRLGTFEDSGLCKGFAFVDFTSTENATSALINPKNHRLDGRNIVVEYASPDAVRRGGIGRQQHKVKTPGPRSPKIQRHAAMHPGEDNEVVVDTRKSVHTQARTDKKGKTETRSSYRTVAEKSDHHQQYRPRPKPGAALALAKRESAAIIPSKGQKIKF